LCGGRPTVERRKDHEDHPSFIVEDPAGSRFERTGLSEEMSEERLDLLEAALLDAGESPWRREAKTDRRILVAEAKKVRIGIELERREPFLTVRRLELGPPLRLWVDRLALIG
jgi:hypothetical protein